LKTRNLRASQKETQTLAKARGTIDRSFNNDREQGDLYMAKLFLTTLPTFEELKQSAEQFCPEIDAVSLHSHLLLKKVSTEFEISFDNYFSNYNLSTGRYTLLLLLRKSENGLMPSELAQKVGVTQATISGLINSLEKSELVIRETHEQDGRAFVIKLTAKGQALVKKLGPDYYTRINRFWEQFNVEERELLNKMFERMIANISLLGMK
jgi:DNA-binding MarR family transcriptional regulator